LNWSIHDNAGWLICTPTSGTNSGVVIVSVAPCTLPPGPYTGTVYIYAHGASNSPPTVTVPPVIFTLIPPVMRMACIRYSGRQQIAPNNTDGIGSRYFTIDNVSGGDSIKANTAPQNHKYSPPIRVQQLKDLPIDQRTPVKMRKGFREDIPPREIYAGDDGLIQIEIKELERIELDLSASFSDTSKISGYLLVGDRILSLPIGSTLKDGVFYWIPGLAFFGKYRLVFIEQGPYGEMNRKDIIVKIGPKFEK